jgi:hypothetical protein
MKSSSHPQPHLDPAAQERLLLLIATLAQFPGVGCPESTKHDGHHDALQAVVTQMQTYAQSIGHPLPAYSVHTLRKDCLLLKRYGILDNRMYRWGYYLGTGAMSREELGLALQALAAQAEIQGDPRILAVYQRLERRLRGVNLELGGQLFYPVRSQLERTIVPTNPDEMRRKGEYKSTLFARLPELEQAMITGQAIEIYRRTSPYQPKRVGHQKVYPLQLIYADIAWYLLTENVENGHLAVSRLDRFSDYWQPLAIHDRGLEKQKQQLTVAHTLLHHGWGLSLGNFDEQQLERQCKLSLIDIRVRFFQAVAPFILEGQQRHPRQQLKRKRKNHHGQIIELDYCIQLPPRSVPEFSRWVRSFGTNAQVIAPAHLVQDFAQMAQTLSQMYPHLPPS